MAGVTDPIFRTLCKEMGADVMVTEFVSAEGVIQAWHRTHRYVVFHEEHRPLGVQIFGSNPERMAEAARIIWDAMRPDFIDINAGCPVPKVVGKNGGSSLLRDLPLLQSITQAVVREMEVDACPVTVKIRTGWDAANVNALECCTRLQDAGAAAITIHGRTRSMQYGGEADWDIIDACARSVSVPIIGNGDISSPADVLRVKESSAVSAVMIGRAALGNPWIFRQCRSFLDSGLIPEPPSRDERMNLMLRHAKMALESNHYGSELSTMRAMRSRLLSYAKGISGSKPFRVELARVLSGEHLEDIMGRMRGDNRAADLGGL